MIWEPKERLNKQFEEVVNIQGERSDTEAKSESTNRDFVGEAQRRECD